MQPLNRSTAFRPQNRPIKILQFGKGNFLRGFADWMVDILNQKTSFNGAIHIVQSNSKETDDRFNRQDGLYHVVINGMQHGKPFRAVRLISAVAGITNPFENYEKYLQLGELGDLQFIVSNTTEAGISFDDRDSDPTMPAGSFPGKLTQLLYRRFTYFKGDPRKSLTLLPCELIEKNGTALRRIVHQYIAHWDLGDDFRQWIDDHTLFCNTLVDRIVPGFPKDKVEEFYTETGFHDELVVSVEPYHLFVIEPVPVKGFSVDKLKIALPLEQAGLEVKFVTDLGPYRSRKVRILNGTHTCMVPLAYFRGLRTVREAINDPSIGRFVRETIDQEIIPTLDLPEKELQQFADDVIERFQNPFIRHELLSIALNSVSKFQVRVLPTILDYIDRKGKLPDRLLQALAGLILFYKGEWQGEKIPLKDTDSTLSLFKLAWDHAETTAVVNTVLRNRELWKTDLTQIQGFAARVEEHITELLKSSASPGRSEI